MKIYRVILTKAYAVIIKSETKEKAKYFAEFYTGDVRDISTDENRRKSKFSIEEIDCRTNESLEAEEIKND